MVCSVSATARVAMAGGSLTSSNPSSVPQAPNREKSLLTEPGPLPVQFPAFGAATKMAKKTGTNVMKMNAVNPSPTERAVGLSFTTDQ